MLPYQSGKCSLITVYGYRPGTDREREFHGGIDLVGIDTFHGKGENVVAITDGEVIRSRMVSNYEDEDWKFGHYVVIMGDDGVATYYCHLRKRNVRVGDRVRAGEIIGIQGVSGDTDIPHLHLEFRQGGARVNPAEYLGIQNKRGIYCDSPELEDEAPVETFRRGGRVKIDRKDAVYNNGDKVSAAERGKIYTIFRVAKGCALLRESWRWIPLQYLKKYAKA